MSTWMVIFVTKFKQIKKNSLHFILPEYTERIKGTYVRVFFFSLYLILALSLACGHVPSKFDSQGDSPTRDNPQSWYSVELFSPTMLGNWSGMFEWTWPWGNPRLMFLVQLGFISAQLVLLLITCITLADPPALDDWKATQSCWIDDDA